MKPSTLSFDVIAAPCPSTYAARSPKVSPGDVGSASQRLVLAQLRQHPLREILPFGHLADLMADHVEPLAQLVHVARAHRRVLLVRPEQVADHLADGAPDRPQHHHAGDDDAREHPEDRNDRVGDLVDLLGLHHVASPTGPIAVLSFVFAIRRSVKSWRSASSLTCSWMPWSCARTS